MPQNILLTHLGTPDNPCPVEQFGSEQAQRVQSWHASFPEYKPTPLVRLDGLACDLGLGALFVKDESKRFDLNAFKVLGGSYAIGTLMAERLGMPLEELPYEALTSPQAREQLGEITFVTATDGNHGRGVAWTANRMQQRSVVYMPHGSAPERLENIRKLGADASITNLNYDDAVRLANRAAAENGWLLIQDTAWEGYEHIPTLIMQGYTTLALEAVQQLDNTVPTHVFLQAGVGALAGAVTAFLADFYGPHKPVITIVEPHEANCMFRTARANDGTLHTVDGGLSTIMAGLACGEPCSIAWEILHDYAEHFASIPDDIATIGMRALARPLANDTRIVSGESGAAGVGLVVELMRNPQLAGMREQLGLGADSVVLCISTEGDTDRENYRRIVGTGRMHGDACNQAEEF